MPDYVSNPNAKTYTSLGLLKLQKQQPEYWWLELAKVTLAKEKVREGEEEHFTGALLQNLETSFRNTSFTDPVQSHMVYRILDEHNV